MNWRQHAECRKEDPELFFPIGTRDPARTQADAAKSVCRRCPVVEQCLTWALRSGQEYGIWGCTTESERRALRRARRPGRAVR